MKKEKRIQAIAFLEKLLAFLEKLLAHLPLRVALALTTAFLTLLGLTLLEQQTTGDQDKKVCLPQEEFLSCSEKQLLLVLKVDNLEGFSILFGVSFYVLESLERRKRTIYEAWQIVDNAAGARVPTSPARVKALEDLNSYGVSMRGLDAPKSDLIEINLANAKLHQATLNEAELTGANLTGADLNQANLIRADLKVANLSEALLIRAKLSKANLSGANLSNADLRLSHLDGANLSEANLSGANLSGANLKLSNLSGANLSGANLSGANLEDISCSQRTSWKNVKGLEKVENMPEALRQQLGL
ncbi:MAG: pentapeptide repeat-containing protein [Symploca sp. SIO2E9]|nr:pentapeptide repeat-containing protein [Symploca sp. SIO2E9]